MKAANAQIVRSAKGDTAPPRLSHSALSTHHGALSRKSRLRRGIIFVTAMWVILILGAMVLIFARSMRVEVAAAANRLSTEQASAIELGAEQYVISAVDASNGDAVTVMATPAEQIPIYGTKNPVDGSTPGSGYFWILQALPDDDYDYGFGITDECSKLNLNAAGDTSLASLPGITQDIADSIVDWRDANENVTGQGAESSYYQSLPRPYMAKNAPFETVDELYLVKNMTDTIMYGYDLDHNGMIDENESGAGGMSTGFNATNGTQDTGRGIAPFVTVWGTEPNTDAKGKPRLNISNLSSTAALRNVLIKVMPAARVTQIVARAQAIRTFRNVYDFAFKTGMKSSELAQVADKLTTTPAKVLPGLVNVNTASQQVLMCLPGITETDAASIVAQRGGGSSGLGGLTGGLLGGGTIGGGNVNGTSATWIMDVLSPPKAAAIGALITGKSYFFSADILAASGDGRAYKRVRIVVDARSSPPVIVYRKDLTHLGWPLSPDILKAMKTNQPLPAASGLGTGGGNGLSL